jgi:transposase IS66 family protein
MIPFKFVTRPAFIEPLLDYNEQEGRLRTHSATCAVTSLMIGELGSQVVTPGHIQQWFPFDFQWVLSLATGNEVGFPWIEIRNAGGQLLRRLHLSVPPTVPIANGARPAIPTGQEIGHLLTTCQSAKGFGHDYLRGLLINTLRGGPRDQWIAEDAMMHLVRGFEGLCRQYGISSGDPLSDLDLAEQSLVREMLRKASDRIRELASRKPQQVCESLNRTANRILSVGNRRNKDFGIAVVDLLRREGLPASPPAPAPRCHSRPSRCGPCAPRPLAESRDRPPGDRREAGPLTRTLFLRQPGAPLDNNISERALKKTILHRKNALFYKTTNGARIGDLFMSLIHTCELCGANAFDYLTELQRHAADLARNPLEWLPWNYRETLARASPAAVPL